MAKAQKSSNDPVAKLKKQLSDANTLWDAKYKVLKGQMRAIAEESYIKGYHDALIDQTKIDEAFDKHMEKAAEEFERKHLKKAKTPTKEKPKAKKKVVRKKK